MGRAGYFAKKVMLSVADIHLAKDNEGCRSLNPITYNVRTKEHLKRLRGRMYRLPHGRQYTKLIGDEFNLIGEDILIKSPVTCECGTAVCSHCYGPDLFHTNKGVGVGAFAGAYVTEPVTQNVLSVKHLNTTVSETIKFSDDFDKFFALTANEISISTVLDNQQNYSLLIIKDNIVSLSELSEGEITDFLTIFHVKDLTTGEIFEINEGSMKEMYLSPDLMEMLKSVKPKKGVYEINFMDIADDCSLFLISIENNELTKPLYNIMGVLDSQKKRDELGMSTISDVCQTMLDLIIDAGIDAQAVHCEMLIVPLVRDKDDIHKRPDFTRYLASEKSQILTLTSALQNHPSPLVGLSSSYLNRQLKNPLTFKKCGTSVVDPFFKSTL